MRLTIAVCLLLSSAVLAACTDAPPPAPGTFSPTDERPGIVPSGPAPPASGLNDTEPLATLPGLRFEDCTGASLRMDVPEDRVQGRLASGLQPVGSLGLSEIYVIAQRCPRVVLPDRVIEDVAFLWTLARVEPLNRSHVEGGYSVYVFEALVTSNETAQALAARGPPAQFASLRSTDVSLPGGGASFDWTFSLGDASARLTFRAPAHAEASVDRLNYHLWSGARPLSRLDVSEEFRLHAPFMGTEVATVELTGESVLHALVGMDQSVAVDSPYRDWTWDLPRAPLTFLEGDDAPSSAEQGERP